MLCDRFGGDKIKLNLSYTTAYRSRIAVVDKYAEIVHEGWVCPKPAALHWDGKIMQELTDKYKENDRLPILVSGGGCVKLLGAPALPIKSGESAGDLISNEVAKHLNKWNCRNQIKSMVFDTTNSNTGHVTAACVSVQQKLQRPLLWSACRKHIGEILLVKVWNALGIEVSKSPEITIFKRFRENGFDATLHTNCDLSLSTKKPSELGKFIEGQASKVKQLLYDIRNGEKTLYERGDYREFLDLMEAHMGDKQHFKFLKPCAVHKARWMGKQLYIYKLVLLKNMLPTGILSQVQLKRLERFANFLTYVYNIWWFQ